MYAREEQSTLDDRQRWSPAAQSQILGQKDTAASVRKHWMSRPFLRLLATNMAFGFSVSCFYLLPKHLTVRYAATPGQVGMVMGMFGLISVLVVPWLGRVVNRLSLPRTLFVSFLLMAGSSMAFALTTVVGPFMFALRALQGLATAGVMTAGMAMVCELAPAERLGQAMGLAGAASLIMNAIAPAVAEPIGARYGFHWVFVASGLVALMGAWIAFKLPSSTPVVKPRADVVFSPRTGALLAVLGLLGAGFNVVMTFLAPLALSRGVNQVSGFFVAYTLSALSIRTLGGRLTDWLGLRRAALLGLLAYGSCIAAIATVGPRALVVLGLGFGFAHGMVFPALMALLFLGSDPASRTKLAGWSNGVLNLGMLTVLGFGQMADRLGLVVVFVSTGMLVTSSVLVLRKLRASSDPTS